MKKQDFESYLDILYAYLDVLEQETPELYQKWVSGDDKVCRLVDDSTKRIMGYEV